MKKKVIALILALAIGSSASVSVATCTKTPAEAVKSVKAALTSAVANSQCGVLLGKIPAASSCSRQSNTVNKNCSANSKSACNVSSCPANSENTYSAASASEKASCSSKSLSEARSASNAKSGNQRTCSSSSNCGSSCGGCNYSSTSGKALNDILNSFYANAGFCGNTSKAAPKPSSSASKSLKSNSYSTFQNEVVQLVNAERKKAGLSGLAENASLMKTATIKSEDMAKNNYFSHTSPTYGSPFDLMKKFGISYHAAGENIAMGQKTPEQVMKAWMNSPGHRKNILNPSFTKIGVGVAKNSENQYYWTQHFIG